MRYQLVRPSLKLTARTDAPPGHRLACQVWNPFLRIYQPVASVEEGVQRVSELADLIGRMWTRQHPKLALLEDVPEADLIDRARWAELRINPTIQRGYDTRQDDHPAWEPAVGLVQATGHICERVGASAADGVPHRADALSVG
jgi:hypothetical protein